MPRINLPIPTGNFTASNLGMSMGALGHGAPSLYVALSVLGSLPQCTEEFDVDQLLLLNCMNFISCTVTTTIPSIFSAAIGHALRDSARAVLLTG